MLKQNFYLLDLSLLFKINDFKRSYFYDDANSINKKFIKSISFFQYLRIRCHYKDKFFSAPCA